jgi:hypothetical protein
MREMNLNPTGLGVEPFLRALQASTDAEQAAAAAKKDDEGALLHELCGPTYTASRPSFETSRSIPLITAHYLPLCPDGVEKMDES